MKFIAVGFVIVVGIGVAFAVRIKGAKTQSPQMQILNASAGSNSEAPNQDTNNSNARQPQPADQAAAFSKRMLAINVKDYMYMNPTNYGRSEADRDGDRRDFYKFIESLRTQWNIPSAETFYLTDGPVENRKIDYKHPPLKMVIRETIERFLATSRDKDRIVIIFSGHAIEKNGKAYLAPIEGEMDDSESLIPLDYIYAKMAKCPAQEKLIVFDVCRYDPGRGEERPAFGKMTEALENALHNCPDGVSVWTSCSRGQYAYEYDYAAVDMRRLRQWEMSGSIFVNMFHAHAVRGRKVKAGPQNDPQPDDPLPILAMAEYVNELTNEVVGDLEHQEQKPKLTMKPQRNPIKFNPKAPPPGKFEFPNPPPSAKRADVASIFQEISLPSIKAIRRDDGKASRFAENLLFTEEALADYRNSEEIQQSPQKHAAEYPLRVATVEAILAMRGLKEENARDEMPEEVIAPINNKFKKKIADVYQPILAKRQSILEDRLLKLKEAAKKRDMEKSKRWLANFDYACAQVRIRLAYLGEYNAAFGNVKNEQLPELNLKANHKGWRLITSEKMLGPKDVREMGEDGKNALDDLIKANKHTPWAVMAKTQRNTIIGLKWKPSSFGTE